jgi:nucleoside-diphosphate-sugar epimerase
MKIFVAGASGALGRLLVPMLVHRGHEVVGMTRTESKRELLAALGAQPVLADALDPDAVGRVVADAAPEVVVHQLTAIPLDLNMEDFEGQLAMTNRLRVEGTDHLLAAARAAGARRFVAQSFAPLAAVSEPPAPKFQSTIAAIRYLEEAVTGADWTEGLVLRYGYFYGPGTGMDTPWGEPSIDVRDAALATVDAIENGGAVIREVVEQTTAA